MTQTEITHSSFIYDRKPIVVAPNVCALPGRGERAMDSFIDPECDLESLTPVHRRKKIGYFHPRAFEGVEFEAVEGDQPEQSSSLLFARDSSYLSSPYRVPNDTLYDTPARTHFRPIQTIGTLDASDAASDLSIPGNFRLNGPMDACQFIQNVPHMDLSLPFMPSKPPIKMKEKDFFSSPKKKSTTRSRTTGTTNSFERTRKVVSQASCGGFNPGVFDSGLEGCLDGF